MPPTLRIPALEATRTPGGWTATHAGKPLSAPTIGALAAMVAEAALRESEGRVLRVTASSIVFDAPVAGLVKP